MRTFFIVNPFSRCRTTGRFWRKVEQEQVKGWGWEYDWALTEGPGHATDLALSALMQGYQMVVAVGGDGTLHEIINGFFQNEETAREPSILGLLPSGTGTDFAKMLRIPRSMDEAAKRLRNGRPRAIDLGTISCQDLKGGPIQRVFANIADGGMGAETVKRVNSGPKKGGTLPFLVGAIRTLMGYQNCSIRVRVDDQTERAISAVIAIVANGRYFGGGMRIAPQAEFDDGLFDVVLIKDLPRFRILANLYRIYTGTHVELPEVEVLRGKKVALEAEEEFLLEADGELLGRAPAEFAIRPRAIRVMC